MVGLLLEGLTQVGPANVCRNSHKNTSTYIYIYIHIDTYTHVNRYVCMELLATSSAQALARGARPGLGDRAAAWGLGSTQKQWATTLGPLTVPDASTKEVLLFDVFGAPR